MMNWRTTITITLHKAKIINVFTYYIITQTSNTVKERIKKSVQRKIIIEEY